MPVHGKGARVWIDNSAGTPVEVSTYSRNISDTETTETAESSNFQQVDKTYVVGMSDKKITIAGTFETAFLQLIRAVKAAQASGATPTTTVMVAPAGNTTGSPNQTQECLVTSIAVTATTGDVVTLALEFQRTGPTVDGTF